MGGANQVVWGAQAKTETFYNVSKKSHLIGDFFRDLQIAAESRMVRVVCFYLGTEALKSLTPVHPQSPLIAVH